MDEYRNAYNSNGDIVCIDNVTDETRKIDMYRCIGCGAEMVACCGEKNKHYFRHKANCKCNGMTYIHKFVELTYFNEIKRLLENKKKLVANIPRKCNLMTAVDCKKSFAVNLLDYYDDVELEFKDKSGMIPDICLLNKKRGDVLFIEIANTHFCDSKKIESGVRIIEIDVRKWTDENIPSIEHVLGGIEECVGFYNFRVKSYADCGCNTCEVKPREIYFGIIKTVGKGDVDYQHVVPCFYCTKYKDYERCDYCVSSHVVEGVFDRDCHQMDFDHNKRWSLENYVKKCLKRQRER